MPVTYEIVSRAAEAIVGDGMKPTFRTVLGRVGGSAKAVNDHLKAWHARRAETLQIDPTIPRLPVALANAIVEEIDRQRSEARANADVELVDKRLQIEALEREVAEAANAKDAAEAIVESLRMQLGHAEGGRSALEAECGRLRAYINELISDQRVMRDHLNSAVLAQAEAHAGATEARAESARLRCDLSAVLRQVSEARLRQPRFRSKSSLVTADVSGSGWW